MLPSDDNAPRLAGTHVLVVEDELLLALELETILKDSGAEKVYVCRNVDDAVACVESRKLTLAILDIRLGRESVAPVARRLTNCGTPFLFYTGQVATDPMFAEWPGCKIVKKPARSKVISNALVELIH
jgi:DNA-binding response OmpR family regulator